MERTNGQNVNEDNEGLDFEDAFKDKKRKRK